MSLPPPLPARQWGRVPMLAPVVSALAGRARAEHLAVRALAHRERLPFHLVAQLPELDASEAVELQELQATPPVLEGAGTCRWPARACRASPFRKGGQAALECPSPLPFSGGSGRSSTRGPATVGTVGCLSGLPSCR